MTGIRNRIAARAIHLTAALAVLGVAGCSAPDGGAGPTLEPVGSVLLQETGGVYLARPGGLAVDDAGNIFVTDYFQKQIVQFDAAGNPVATFGSPGRGPGEFSAIGESVLLFDTLVAAQDYRQRLFNVYGLRSRKYLGSRRVQGVVTTGTVRGSDAWLAHIDKDRKLGMSVWNLPREGVGPELALRAPLMADRVPLPAEYLSSEVLRGTFPLVYAAPWADSALVGFSASPWVLAVTATGQVADSVRVPVRARRGVPDDLVERLNGPSFDLRATFRSLSGQYGMSRAPDGTFLLAHLDPEIHDGNRITGRLFVSLLSADRQRACVDREVPVSDVSQPLVAFRGDTLLVLEQRLNGEANASTTLKRYRVTPAGCQWVPTEHHRS